MSTRKATVYTLISAENNNYKKILNYAYVNDAIIINYKEAIDLEKFKVYSLVE